MPLGRGNIDSDAGTAGQRGLIEPGRHGMALGVGNAEFITIKPPFLFLNWFSSQHAAFSELPITEFCSVRKLNALIVNLRIVTVLLSL